MTLPQDPRPATTPIDWLLRAAALAWCDEHPEVAWTSLDWVPPEFLAQAEAAFARVGRQLGRLQ